MKRTVVAGSFQVVVQTKPRGRWKDSLVPCFDPNWVARFSIPGVAVKAESTRWPVCADCLKLRAGDAPSYNEKCARCRPAREWADARLRRLVHDWQQRRIKGELEPMMPRLRVPLSRVAEIYGASGLESADDNLHALRLLVEVPTGRTLETMFADEVTADLARRFAALYQEYGRRGWSVRGAAPDDAWAQLRALVPEPVMDWEAAQRWNTTIRSTIRCAKAVLGQKSRDRYLLPMAKDLPVLKEFLTMTMTVPVPDSRVMMDGATLEEIYRELAELKKVNLRMWAALKLTDETGIRTIELAAVKTWWLEVDDGDTVYLVVKNRPGEFRLKARHSHRARGLPLSAELVGAIRALAGKQDGSVFGPGSVTSVENLLREASEWLRRFVGSDSTHTLYQFGRKVTGTVQTRVHGAEAGANALGHEDARVTRAKYVSPDHVSKSLSAEQRVMALGTGRRPWSPA